LFQINVLEAALFLKLAAGRIFECFVHADEAARQRPAAGKRLQIALDEHDPQLILVEGENHDIHGECRTRKFVGVAHRMLLSVSSTLL
jgi:hypothetical protein